MQLSNKQPLYQRLALLVNAYHKAESEIWKQFYTRTIAELVKRYLDHESITALCDITESTVNKLVFSYVVTVNGTDNPYLVTIRPNLLLNFEIEISGTDYVLPKHTHSVRESLSAIIDTDLRQSVVIPSYPNL